MPDNDDVFDLHVHNDHIHRTTGYAHIHDRHPYHQHDANGSVLYINPTTALLIELHPHDFDCCATPAHHLGVGGFDVRWSDHHRRTSPPRPVAGDGG